MVTSQDSVSAESNEELGAEFNRRRFLQLVSATGGVGLAGCFGDGDNGDSPTDTNDTGDGPQEQGERVPTIDLSIWGAYGATTELHQDMAPIAETSFEKLGIDVEVNAPEAFSMSGSAQGDDRENIWDLGFSTHSPDPARLDPEETVTRHRIDWAGPNGKGNYGNYASCEYTRLAVQQSSAESEDERRELINEAVSIFSNDKMIYPMGRNIIHGAWGSDALTMEGIGSRGLSVSNPYPFIKSESADGGAISASVRTGLVETMNWVVRSDPRMIVMYNNLLHSPLATYDENLELINVLADSFSQDGPTQYTYELKDATFHNGDPITADDVKFTFEFIVENSDDVVYSPSFPLDTVEVVDESTARFHLEEAHPAFSTQIIPSWGIFHRETFESTGATENVAEWNPDPDTFVGSGPFAVDSWSASSNLVVTPHPDDGHPVYSPSNDIVFTGYEGTTPAVEALLEGELDIATSLTLGNIDRLENNAPDRVSTDSSPVFTIHHITPQYHLAPTKFEALRDAIGTVLNRQEVNQVAHRGENEMDLFADHFTPDHPWRPPDDMLHKYTDSMTGDEQAARQKLEDGGFTWDDDGNLRYPPDADLSPLWPAEEFPQQEDFPCVDGEGGLDL